MILHLLNLLESSQLYYFHELQFLNLYSSTAVQLQTAVNVLHHRITKMVTTTVILGIGSYSTLYERSYASDVKLRARRVDSRQQCPPAVLQYCGGASGTIQLAPEC